MWELDCEEGWAPKNWCFWTVVLEKTFKSPLDCKEIKLVNSKGNQLWIFTGRADAETPIFWQPDGLQHARLPCPSPAPGVHSDSRPSSPWCHPTISSSVIPFSSCLQSLQASGYFPMSQLLAWGGQSTGVSALPSFLPKKSQGWSPLEWTSWISLQSKGLSRVFSNTTVQKH